MISSPEAKDSGVTSFRIKLLVAMAFVVLAITISGLYFAERKVAAETEHDLERDFQAALASLHSLQEMRHAALAERCRALVQKPRIHAALEDNAVDLLYPSAKDELRDLVVEEDGHASESAVPVLQAKFYRFLDAKGAVISPPTPGEVGELSADEEKQLALNAVPDQQQLGYLVRRLGAGQAILEIIAMKISSTETGEAIAAIVLGFNPPELKNTRADMGMKSGIWLNGRLYLPFLAESGRATLASEMARVIATAGRAESGFTVRIDGTLHRLFYKRLNPGSLYPAAYEICIYPLSDLLARQRQLRWQAAGACALLLVGGILASHFLSLRLSVPVEKLAVDSAENLVQRQRAEAALELTNEELQRAARFSADASHQLKTPVTVLRTGLEELLAQENLTLEMREEIAELVHQTYRLASVIEDLLLLSRMDAGRLKLEFTSVNLTHLIEASLDDLSALPDTLDLAIETDFPPALHIAGEKRYTTLIVQNLLENARKYNRPGGRIRVMARADGDRVFLTVGNTGRPIPVEARKNIFERFHRGSIGENVPGHGLGLNIARELARIHGGDLRLARSEEGWTEFEVHFRLARQIALTAPELA